MNSCYHMIQNVSRQGYLNTEFIKEAALHDDEVVSVNMNAYEENINLLFSKLSCCKVGGRFALSWNVWEG